MRKSLNHCNAHIIYSALKKFNYRSLCATRLTSSDELLGLVYIMILLHHLFWVTMETDVNHTQCTGEAWSNDNSNGVSLPFTCFYSLNCSAHMAVMLRWLSFLSQPADGTNGPDNLPRIPATPRADETTAWSRPARVYKITH